MHAKETVTLANMCMVTDGHGNVLVEDRIKSWKGIAFPGGHVEFGESLTDSVIREIREETGLVIAHPRLIGVKDWTTEEGRYLVFLYRADQYTGELHESDEGNVFWIPIESLPSLNLAVDFIRDVQVFLHDELSEHYFSVSPDGQEIDVLK